MLKAPVCVYICVEINQEVYMYRYTWRYILSDVVSWQIQFYLLLETDSKTENQLLLPNFMLTGNTLSFTGAATLCQETVCVNEKVGVRQRAGDVNRQRENSPFTF